MQFSIMFATHNIPQFMQVKRKDRLLAEPSFSFVVFMWFNTQHRYMQISQVTVELNINIPCTINAEKVKPT